jgi:hypothetical protein
LTRPAYAGRCRPYAPSRNSGIFSPSRSLT